MQQAVDNVRAKVGQSIEQIMLDVVQNQPDGLGPCTRVDCLLNSSMEAARIFIFEQQMRQEQMNNHGQYHDDVMYHDDMMVDGDMYHEAKEMMKEGMDCDQMCDMQM